MSERQTDDDYGDRYAKRQSELLCHSDGTFLLSMDMGDGDESHEEQSKSKATAVVPANTIGDVITKMFGTFSIGLGKPIDVRIARIGLY